MTVIKSTCGRAWLISDQHHEELRIICPDDVPVPVAHILRDLKPENSIRFSQLAGREQYDLFIKMMAVKGGCARISSSEINYCDLDVNKLHGKIFLGGLGVGLDVIEIVNNANVAHITIVEQTVGVIELISTRLKHKNISIYKGNPMKFFPDSNYNFMFWSKYQYWLFNEGSSQVTQNYIKYKYIKGV